MTNINENPAINQTDNTHISRLLETLLSRRRSLVPWLLNRDETALLWWPEKSYTHLLHLKEHGGFDGAFSQDTVVSCMVPCVGHSGFMKLNIHGKELPNYEIMNIAPMTNNMSYYTYQQGNRAESTFLDWLRRAQIIHAWNLSAYKLLNNILEQVTSFGQLRKALPDMFDYLAQESILLTISGRKNSYKWDSVTRVQTMLNRYREHGHAGARDTLDHDLKLRIQKVGPPILAALQQATAIPPDQAGQLDASEFRKTWFH